MQNLTEDQIFFFFYIQSCRAPKKGPKTLFFNFFFLRAKFCSKIFIFFFKKNNWPFNFNQGVATFLIRKTSKFVYFYRFESKIFLNQHFLVYFIILNQRLARSATGFNMFQVSSAFLPTLSYKKNSVTVSTVTEKYCG